MIYSLLIIVAFLIITFLLARKSLVWAMSWLLFMLPAYLIRLSIFGIPTTALELGIYLVFGWWLIEVLSKKRQFKWSNYYWLPIAWILVGWLSVAVSDDKIVSLGLWKGWVVDPILLMVVVSQIVKKSWQVDMLVDGLNWLAGLLGLVGLLQVIFGVTITPDGRLSAFFQSPNYLAMLLVPVLIVVLAKLVKGRRTWWGIVFWILGLMALIFSASYVGIGSLLLGVIFLIGFWWLKDINKMLLGVLVVVVLVSGFFMTQFGSDRFSSMVDLSQRSSVSVRLEVWQIGWYMVQENPIWGVGLGNFEEKYMEYAPLVFHPPTEWRMLHAHNLYLNSWLEMTAFGLLAMLAIILLWWSSLFKMREHRSYVVAGIMAVLLAWAIGGLLDTPYYKNDLSVVFWVLFGVTIAGSKMINNSKVKNQKAKPQVKTH